MLDILSRLGDTSQPSRSVVWWDSRAHQPGAFICVSRLWRSSVWRFHVRFVSFVSPLNSSVVSFVFPLKCLSTAVSSCLRGAASPSSVCLHESALGGLYLGEAPCCCLRGGREGRRWRRCSACWSKGEFGVHWGGDRGRRWSLKEGQAHLLAGIRRRQPSKAAVDIKTLNYQ